MKRCRVVLSALVLGLIIFSPSTASAQLPRCADLATNPAYGLAGASTILQPPSAVLSAILIPAGGIVTVPFCRVDFTDFVTEEKDGQETLVGDWELVISVDRANANAEPLDQ